MIDIYHLSSADLPEAGGSVSIWLTHINSVMVSAGCWLEASVFPQVSPQFFHGGLLMTGQLVSSRMSNPRGQHGNCKCLLRHILWNHTPSLPQYVLVMQVTLIWCVRVLPKRNKWGSWWRDVLEAGYSHPGQSIIMKYCDTTMETRNCLDAETDMQWMSYLFNSVQISDL